MENPGFSRGANSKGGDHNLIFGQFFQKTAKQFFLMDRHGLYIIGGSKFDARPSINNPWDKRAYSLIGNTQLIVIASSGTVIQGATPIHKCNGILTEKHK